MSLLSEALDEESSIKRGRCWYAGLEPEDQERIDKAFADGMTNAAILRSLQKANVKTSKDSIARHRNGCTTCQS